MKVQLHSFLTSALDGTEWLVSRRSIFISVAKVPHTSFLRSYMGALEKKHITYRAGKRAKILPSPNRLPSH